VNYNPYAAPQAGPPPMMGAPMGGPPQGGAQPWDIGEILSLAWEGFKRCWGVLIGAIFVDALLAGIPGQISGGLVGAGVVDAGSAPAIILQTVLTLVGLAVGAFLATGLIRIFTTVARGGQPNFGDLFSGGSRMFSILGAQFLMGIAILLGLILLVVPGIILAIGLSFSSYFVADAGMGPIDALKASWAATTGSKGKLFLFGIVGFFIVLLGMLACCIGVFASAAVYSLAQAMIYVRLSGRGTTVGGFDPSGGMGGGYPPQGGYGAPPGGGYGGPPAGGGYGGGAPPAGGGGYGGPPAGGGYGGPPAGGGYGGPPAGGGGYGGPQGGGGGMPGGGGGGYGPPGGGGGYGPPGGGGGGGGMPPAGGGGGGGYGGPPGY